MNGEMKLDGEELIVFTEEDLIILRSLYTIPEVKKVIIALHNLRHHTRCDNDEYKDNGIKQINIDFAIREFYEAAVNLGKLIK